MRGGKCCALTKTIAADVASFAGPASGARRGTQATTASNFDALSIIVRAKRQRAQKGKGSPTMSEYEFTLKFRLPNASVDPEQFVDALAEAGCDDAAVGVGQQGRIALDFIREAPNALQAIVSAVKEVKSAIPGAELVEASPDFVGLTDVAELVGCTRQNVRKLMISNLTTFPLAVHEGTQALWHLRPVLDWFLENQKHSIDRALIEVSDAAMKVNIAKEARRLPGAGLPKDFEVLFT